MNKNMCHTHLKVQYFSIIKYKYFTRGYNIFNLSLFLNLCFCRVKGLIASGGFFAMFKMCFEISLCVFMFLVDSWTYSKV